MKKIILTIIVFLNLLPYLHKGHLLLDGPQAVVAQTQAGDGDTDDGDGNCDGTYLVTAANPVGGQYDGGTYVDDVGNTHCLTCEDMDDCTTEVDCTTNTAVGSADCGASYTTVVSDVICGTGPGTGTGTGDGCGGCEGVPEDDTTPGSFGGGTPSYSYPPYTPPPGAPPLVPCTGNVFLSTDKTNAVVGDVVTLTASVSSTSTYPTTWFRFQVFLSNTWYDILYDPANSDYTQNNTITYQISNPGQIQFRVSLDMYCLDNTPIILRYDADSNIQSVFATTPPPGADCMGVIGGQATYIAGCGCVGGTSTLPPCGTPPPPADCNGDVGGTAHYDPACGCIGGNTGLGSCSTPLCPSGISGVGCSTAPTQVVDVPPSNLINVAGTKTTPCNNMFMMPFNKIVQFSPTQLSNIDHFLFSGGNLVGFVDINNNTFLNDQNATDQINNGDYVNSSSLTTTYKFICYTQLDADIQANTIDIQNAGTTKISANLNGTGQKITVYHNVPNTLKYEYDVSGNGVLTPQVGNMIFTVDANGDTYCRTLTAGDVANGVGLTRLDNFVPMGTSLNLHLIHFINVPPLYTRFLQMVLLRYLTPCTQSYINVQLDALHQSAAWANASFDQQSVLEAAYFGYFGLLGTLSCNSEEANAIGQQPSTQYDMGVVHELVNVLDISNLRQGVTNITNGASNLVANDYAAIISAVDQIVIDEATNTTVDWHSIFTNVISANNSQFTTISNQISDVAAHFKYMYFTGCSVTNVNGQIVDLCEYRHGQVAMMVLPIVFSLGDYAVIQASTLVGTYAANTAAAVTLLSDADAAADVIADANAQNVISNSTAGNIATIEKPANTNTVVINELVDFIRGVAKTDFTSSLVFNGAAYDQTIADQIWLYWKNEQWSTLEQYCINNNVGYIDSYGNLFPPGGGFINVIKQDLPVGYIFDRYGGSYKNGVWIDNGTYVGLDGEPFSDRALPTINPPATIKRYKVIQQISGAQEGQAIPWFGESGLGTQIKLPKSISTLLDPSNPYIVEIP